MTHGIHPDTGRILDGTPARRMPPIQMPVVLLDALTEQARAQGVDRAAMVRMVLAAWVVDLEGDSEQDGRQ